MRKKISNEALRIALTKIENKLLVNGVLPKEYDGYAASLGPAILNSGLLPALAFYSDTEKKNRVKLLEVIAKTAGYQVGETGLLRYVLDKSDKNPKELAKLKREILQATAAVKLAMRNFPHSDSKNN